MTLLVLDNVHCRNVLSLSVDGLFNLVISSKYFTLRDLHDLLRRSVLRREVLSLSVDDLFNEAGNLVEVPHSP